MTNKNIKQEILKELTFEFDYNFGRTNLNIDTLNNMRTLLGHVAEDVDNADKSCMESMAMTFHGIDHKIMILWDLFRHTVEDMEKDLEKTRLIKESYFDIVVKDDEVD